MRTALLITLTVIPTVWSQSNNKGYYRDPALYGNTLVFTAEGDLWHVSIEGGLARRLTSHPASETAPHFSPDGKTLAFNANYEGFNEVYTIPSDGGLPQRRTFGGGIPVGWTPDGRVLYATNFYSDLPNQQLIEIDSANQVKRLPLSQAAQGVYDPSGKTLYFSRLPFQGSYAKRYAGGTAQKLWKYTSGSEAVALTADYNGTSKDAMYWKGRVYFASDRDGTMNLWSMDEAGKNLRQHTRHSGWDIAGAYLNDGRIVYQLGADIHLYNIASNQDRRIDILLPSDFDQLRERWVKNPLQYMTSVALSADGSRLVFTSRGRAFVVPVKQGRLVDATGPKPARIRFATLLPNQKDLLALSTETGEVEIWKLPANGVGPGERLTTDGKVLRWQVSPSPDGKWAVHTDKDNQLWLLDLTTRTQRKVAATQFGGNSFPVYSSIAWSPDSKWFSYETPAANEFDQIFLCSIETSTPVALTSDRYNSNNATWSSDGKYIYFLSDRSLRSVIPSPWGSRQPDPFFDRSMKIYQVPLRKEQRSPFQPDDELQSDKAGDKKAEEKKPDEAKTTEKKPDGVKVEIDLEGLPERLEEVPVPPGNYSDLAAPAKRLCWIDRDRQNPTKNAFQCLDVANKGDKPETLMEGVSTWQLSADRKKMLVRKQNDFFVFDSSIREGAAKTPKTLTDSKVELKDWNFTVAPTEEYREALVDAWRLHRDYFYDQKMHGVDWTLMRSKYSELVNRVRDRAELSDLIAKMVSEICALHTFVTGGDLRQAPDQVPLALLGAYLERDEPAGGWVVRHIYKNDPDRPDKRSPLAQPSANVAEGDVITQINGRATLAAIHPFELLRNQGGKQVLLRVKPAGKTETRDVIVTPITPQQEADLRYHEWEYTRRIQVEKTSGGRMGYVHLRAMGANDIAQFAENYYPVFNRQGLIIDVRHNTGGNIDSWILGKLMRKAWMFWKPRVGEPTWNMQYAFRGHLVVLCDERTGSDGEAFAEGFRRLGLGKVIGTRTWGGEIWLTSSNRLADEGIASAAEIGVFGPEKQWLIEGHGVDPDIVVDNLPHATFNGRDAQLEAAIKHLEMLIKTKPIVDPAVPAYPDKTFRQAPSGNE